MATRGEGWQPGAQWGCRARREPLRHSRPHRRWPAQPRILCAGRDARTRQRLRPACHPANSSTNRPTSSVCSRPVSRPPSMSGSQPRDRSPAPMSRPTRPTNRPPWPRPNPVPCLTAVPRPRRRPIQGLVLAPELGTPGRACAGPHTPWDSRASTFRSPRHTTIRRPNPARRAPHRLRRRRLSRAWPGRLRDRLGRASPRRGARNQADRTSIGRSLIGRSLFGRNWIRRRLCLVDRARSSAPTARETEPRELVPHRRPRPEASVERSPVAAVRDRSRRVR